jgi:uncharacterized membrane protein YbjE (DUF340 family)
MAWILLFLGFGIFLGTLVGHKKKIMRSTSVLSDILVVLLLFLLGAAIGSNAQIMDDLIDHLSCMGRSWASLSYCPMSSGK